MKFFATAAWGTEPALRDELRELRMRAVKCDRGGVHFQGDWQHAFKACLHSRIALRVFLPLAEFEASSEQKLYDGVREISWQDHLTTKHTLAVTAFCRSSALTHTNYVAQKTKDAIVDQQRDKYGERSSVDRRDPDVDIFVHLKKDVATVYLDLAGESLHRRGYRKQTIEAPLKESLAASILRLSGWDRKRPFCDPMCGSGTIAIEAALWSRGVAPGLSRDSFGFERWPTHDKTAQETMAELRQQARDQVSSDGPRVMASDIDEQALTAAKANAKAARAKIDFNRKSVMKIEPLSPAGMIVTNPPFGQRLEADRDFYSDLGAAIRKLKQHRVAILLSQRHLERALKLKAEKFQLLFNGDIQCRLVMFEIKG
jgi:23S rRNA (guanine2445-N2)-methyltransferase